MAETSFLADHCADVLREIASAHAAITFVDRIVLGYGVLGVKMPRWLAVVLYLVLMAATIVAVDYLFFRDRFWARLIVNVGIVLVFAAFYWRFLKPT